MATLTVAEIFGPTFQGEGPSTGRRSSFVRLGRCNLDCSWCDTSYTWDWQGKNGVVFDPALELDRLDVDAVAAEALKADVPLVVITGGEPLVQRSALGDLLALLRQVVDVEIETNGTRPPFAPHPRVRYNVSPKLPGSGVSHRRAFVREALEAFTAADRSDVAWKFVIGTHDDVDDVREWMRTLGLDPRVVWFMAQSEMNGVEPQLRPGEVADEALRAGANYSGRLHVDLWGHERGH